MEKMFWHALVNLCSGIYDLICYVFDIFYYLCGIQLFTDNDYSAIVQKVYIILGLVMMFVLTYSLLKAVINPDQFAKGENSFPKLIQNVVVSIVIIAILPTVFSIAFNFQNSLLKYEVIPKLILGNVDGTLSDGSNTPKITADGVEVSGGRGIAYYTFKSFFTPNLDDDCMDNVDTCRTEIKSNSGIVLADADKTVLQGKTFGYYSIFDKQIAKDEVSFNFLMALAAGGFILYVLLNFCFDMALRVIKLAFYQIIAPIPVICRVIPGGKLKDVFSKWMKQVISLFVEVFVRIAALTLGVYLIALIVEKYDAGLPGIGVLSSGQKNVVIALLIMSVVIFIKQIPKLIGDLFGLDTGGMKLGLMDKLAQGGGLMAASAVGAGATTLARNATNAFKNVKRADGGKAKLKAGLAGLGSVVAGGASGMARGLKAGKGAKNFGDVKKSASSAAKDAIEKREKRANYVASHGGVGGAILGHVTDAAGSVVSWAGVGNIEDLKRENDAMDQITGARDKMENNIDTYIEKQMAKGKGAGVGESISLSHLETLKNKMIAAQQSGIGTVEAERLYNEELKNIRERVANQLLVSTDNWEKYSDEDRAKLGDLRVDAVAFKGAVYNNGTLTAVKEVGINAVDYAQDKDVVIGVKQSPIENLNDSIKRIRGDNNVEIATRSQEKKDDKK